MNDLTTEIKKLELETLDNLKLSKAKNFGTKYKPTSWELRIPNHIKKNINTKMMLNLNIQINKHTLLI